MQRICAVSGEPFEVSPLELEYCAKSGVPLPSISSRERLRHMLYFRNRAYLYHGTCAFSNKSILSCVPPESGLAVYDAPVWDSDDWNAADYARDYDFSRPFFEQFYDLYRRVPRFSRSILGPVENCDYSNALVGTKNCYLTISAIESRDVLFSYSIWRSRDIVDCLYLKDCELCYGSVDLRNCYQCTFCEHCADCSDSAFLWQCRACSDCYLCGNLRHRRYCFRNEQLSREDYAARRREIDLGGRRMQAVQKKLFAALARDASVKFCAGENNSEASGNFIAGSKNCRNSFFISNSEDIADSLYLDGARNSIVHASFGINSDTVYHSLASGSNVLNLRFCIECRSDCCDLEYCVMCSQGCRACFGCVGLKHAEYSILNKRYTKADYLETIDRIRAQMRAGGEYGRFFPLDFSPYYYNQSEVSDFFPLSREAALARGFRWKDAPAAQPAEGGELPDHIRDAGDDILERTLTCSQSGAAFRIVKPELEYYRRHGLAVPDTAPLERIRARLGFFEVAPLRPGRCRRCGAEFETVYDETRRTIYCERCFQEEIFA